MELVESRRLVMARLFVGLGAVIAILRSISACFHSRSQGRTLHLALAFNYGLLAVVAMVWRPFADQLFPFALATVEGGL